jgi:hypothetical protein
MHLFTAEAASSSQWTHADLLMTLGNPAAANLLLLQVHVPAGQQVMSFLYGYQRDPDYWPAAAEFRPERWLPVRPVGGRRQLCCSCRCWVAVNRIALGLGLWVNHGRYALQHHAGSFG